MKKLIKLLLVSALVAITPMAVMANDGMHFPGQDNTAGGFISNEAVFVYNKQDLEKMKSPGALKILVGVARTQICKDETIKVMIDDGSLKIKYIYLSDKPSDGFIIVNIDRCKS